MGFRPWGLRDLGAQGLRGSGFRVYALVVVAHNYSPFRHLCRIIAFSCIYIGATRGFVTPERLHPKPLNPKTPHPKSLISPIPNRAFPNSFSFPTTAGYSKSECFSRQAAATRHKNLRSLNNLLTVNSTFQLLRFLQSSRF